MLFVLTEELGHFLDDQLSRVDSQGDEGEQFAAALLPEVLPTSSLAGTTAAESGTITAAGEQLAAEFSSASTAFAEYGQVAANQTWQTISLTGVYTDPVVIVSDPSSNGGDPVAVRLRNVDRARLSCVCRSRITKTASMFLSH